ncbi:iron/zinc/copper transport system substrate-binding protein [Granulicatella balaenopterae]|uniref:Iron/zinc/copper transport system substrate-binding protein n=1 Tax=Granulicatella balaenopterae TaxID=137733 RepID=A0A1H9JDC9_9LACT|nr:metal ABC transporter substrate-binding protein [Granulicatella balaenopterae]SEQ84767.1 iron/zinc/copper transport system substrate-binding protein [Granulicatella balaenopterae]
MKKVMSSFKFIVTIMLGFLLVACSPSTTNTGESSDTPKPQTEQQEPLKVVVTNSILYDMTKNIAGDKIDLHSIVPVGQDPHEYEPLPEDVQKTSRADVIFYNGINLETGGNAWFTKLVENANKVANEDYFAVSDGIDVIYLEGESEQGKEDPHAWLNIENGIIYATNIAKHLGEKDPANKEFYDANLKEYVAKLDKLDKEAKSKFDAIPAEKKLIVTSEGCFKYFSKAYGVPSAYIWEINTEEEGTPEQITNLVNKLNETEVPALFVETSVDDRPMKTISNETGIPIYEKIFTDSIANEGENGDSYYSMMKWNLDKISEGLAQ